MFKNITPDLIVFSFSIAPLGFCFKNIYFGVLNKDAFSNPTEYFIASITSSFLISPVLFLGILFLEANYGIFRRNHWAEIIVFGGVALLYIIIFENYKSKIVKRKDDKSN